MMAPPSKMVHDLEGQHLRRDEIVFGNWGLKSCKISSHKLNVPQERRAPQEITLPRPDIA